MTLLIIVVAFCVLGLFAARFGQDSRDRLHSNEEDAAARGMTWEGIF